MTIGEIIKEYRRTHKISMEAFAKRANKSKGYISMLEKGRNPQTQKPISPSLETLQSIASAMDVDFDNLVSILDENQAISTIPTTAPDELVTAITKKVVQLNTQNKKSVLRYSGALLDTQKADDSGNTVDEPLYEYKVYEKLSVGTGFTYFNDGNYDTVFHDEYIDHDFASRVFGDSMEPTYLNGEVVLIKETGFDYDGAIYAIDWDGQTYIKKVYREENGLRLISLNSKYQDKFAPYNEDPRIIGKIIAHFQPTEG